MIHSCDNPECRKLLSIEESIIDNGDIVCPNCGCIQDKNEIYQGAESFYKEELSEQSIEYPTDIGKMAELCSEESILNAIKHFGIQDTFKKIDNIYNNPLTRISVRNIFFKLVKKYNMEF